MIRKIYKIFTWRQGRCGYLSFILYLSKKYLATVHSTVCPFSNWRGKLCICAGFLVTLQTLENGGKMLLLFGNHDYLILLSKCVFLVQFSWKGKHLCRFLCDDKSNGRGHLYTLCPRAKWFFWFGPDRKKYANQIWFEIICVFIRCGHLTFIL